jgi:hypothetical protein
MAFETQHDCVRRDEATKQQISIVRYDTQIFGTAELYCFAEDKTEDEQ